VGKKNNDLSLAQKRKKSIPIREGREESTPPAGSNTRQTKRNRGECFLLEEEGEKTSQG